MTPAKKLRRSTPKDWPSITPEIAADSNLFEEIIRPMLARGLSVRFQARGASMSPTIRDGEIVEVIPVNPNELRPGDIILAKSDCGFRMHRIVVADPARDLFITRGDCGRENDPPIKANQILGLARAKEVLLGRGLVHARFKGMSGRMLRTLSRTQYLTEKAWRLLPNVGSPAASRLR